MQKKGYEFHDSLENVAGLRQYDDVLIVGGNAVFPGIRRFVNSVDHVKKIKDVDKMLTGEKIYDRVFIARENLLSEALVIKAVKLCGRPRPDGMNNEAGITCFFSEHEGMREAFTEIVENNWPSAELWPVESNVGPLVMTNASGNPQGMD